MEVTISEGGIKMEVTISEGGVKIIRSIINASCGKYFKTIFSSILGTGN